ncbi:MAG: Murein tetrapeptide carboxypeptidase [Burkholderiaceae bacterium]|nr:Murein tetrapeptide carboxypeptidase [Burkholderiaceae bacterium]
MKQGRAHGHAASGGSSVVVFGSAGVELRASALQRARKRLRALGFEVTLDPSVKLRHQRFAGSDEQRLATLHRVADSGASIAMACRGGYGMTRLLDSIDWKRIGRSVERGTRWVGYSDMTALQMGLLAHTGASSWAGPMACDDFGRSDADGGVDDVTRDCFVEAMGGALRALGFRTEPGHDGLHVRGVLWGGNLAMLCSLLGTPHFPRVKGGILFVEEVNEHPYRVERCLLQLHQAGVLRQQKALLVGAVTGFAPSPLDRGYTIKSAIAHLRGVSRTPILTGLPFGHVRTKMSFPVGRRIELAVQGRDVFFGW